MTSPHFFSPLLTPSIPSTHTPPCGTKLPVRSQLVCFSCFGSRRARFYRGCNSIMRGEKEWSTMLFVDVSLFLLFLALLSCCEGQDPPHPPSPRLLACGIMACRFIDPAFSLHVDFPIESSESATSAILDCLYHHHHYYCRSDQEHCLERREVS